MLMEHHVWVSLSPAKGANSFSFHHPQRFLLVRCFVVNLFRDLVAHPDWRGPGDSTPILWPACVPRAFLDNQVRGVTIEILTLARLVDPTYPACSRRIGMQLRDLLKFRVDVQADELEKHEYDHQEWRKRDNVHAWMYELVDYAPFPITVMSSIVF